MNCKCQAFCVVELCRQTKNSKTTLLFCYTNLSFGSIKNRMIPGELKAVNRFTRHSKRHNLYTFKSSLGYFLKFLFKSCEF